MKTKTLRSHYFLHDAWLLLLAVGLGVQPVASAVPVTQLNWVGPYLDQPAHLTWLFMIIVQAVLLVLAGLVYLLQLNPMMNRRPKAAVWLNWLAPALFAGLCGVGWGISVEAAGDGIWALAGAGGVVVIFPLLPMAAEALVRRVCRGLGCWLQERQWRRSALFFLTQCLRFDPADSELRRRAGLLFALEDEFDLAIAMLERVCDIKQTSDDKILRELERAYRANGRIEQALACLLRLRKLEPDNTSLDRRVLDDYVRLDRPEKALEILELGRLKENLTLLRQHQQIHMRLGHYEQALPMIHRIAEMENEPYDVSIRLYQDFLEAQPGAIEAQRRLGELLLKTENEERCREGARHLEDVLYACPQDLEISRTLASFYRQAGLENSARDQYRHLVEHGDTHADPYLEYATVLNREERFAEAAQVLERLTQVAPEDWRGHLRLARVCFRLERNEQAEQALARAAWLTNQASDQEGQALVQHLRRDIDRRRSEQLIATMSAEAQQRGNDTEHRLELIEELISMEWIDRALSQCEEVLTARPDLQPRVEQLLLAGIAKAEHNYQLRDYLGDLYFKQERYEDLLGLFRDMAQQALDPAQVLTDGCQRILAREPMCLAARQELAFARRSIQDWAGVLEALEPLMQDPADPLLPEDKALWVEACWKLERTEEALDVGGLLLDDLCDEVSFVLMMVNIYEEAGDHENAFHALELGVKALPEEPRLKRLTGAVRRRSMQQRLDRLGEKYQAEGLSGPEHFEKAELHREMGDMAAAIVHYQRAADEQTLAHVALAKMAVSLCERGMYDMAEETLDPIELTRPVVEEHPELKDLFYQVARQLEKIKRYKPAIKYYKCIFRVDAGFSDVVQRLERLS